MVLSIIAAMDRNHLIGQQNRLPWHLPADLRHFKRVTMGRPIIMGRNTWESIGRPLPGRENIVVSRSLALDEPGCTVVRSVEQALAAASRHSEAMVIGGAVLYAHVLSRTDRLYLTLIDAEFEGDTFFPRYDPAEWAELSSEEHPADEENDYPYRFVTLERRTAGPADSPPAR